MSDVFEPEVELSQDIAAQEPMDSSVAEPSDQTKPEKKGLAESVLSMGLFNVMLLLSLIFICWATLNMLGILRTYSDGFPLGGGYPWSTNL